MLLIMTGCGSGNDTATPVEQDTPEQTVSESNDINDTDAFVPSVPVPDGLPVYPGAILSNELPAGEGHWQWLYSTTGSGNEIVDFFVGELQALGFEINDDFTFAEREEFFVTTADEIIHVYWLDSDELSSIEDVNADTPNRHYAIVVHQEGWSSR